MSIFNSIKKLFSGTGKNNTAVADVPKTQTKEEQSKLLSKSYLKQVNNTKYRKLSTIDVTISEGMSWDSFFSVKKENPKLIGFDKRSRKKFKHLFHNENLLIVHAAGAIELISKESVREYSFKGRPVEKFTCVEANEHGAILHQKEKVCFVNFQTGNVFQFVFSWQPFSFAMGDTYWLIGTRETYNGPGELYCFDFDGQMKWALGFNERMNTLFGELEFMPYTLQVSDDSTDILVGSMDRLYRLDGEGNLKARIAISELKEAELQKKQIEMQKALSVPPKNEDEAISRIAEQIASQFMSGFERMTFNSPYAGFAHDPETDMIFILEEKGRVSAWDSRGSLVWLNAFKNEGRYIDWIDNKLVVSFTSGETFWIDRDGKFVYGAKLPKQADTIALIPGQEKFLVVCQDNRLYELSKETGETITGSEGHPGMQLFTLFGQNVFFDGTANSQGYFWLAPPGHRWTHFEAKSILDKTDGDSLDNLVAPEITETKKFNQAWEVKGDKDWLGSRIVDFKYNRIYAVENVETEREDYDRLLKMTETQREIERRRHVLICYDFASNVLWRKEIFSSMWSLYLSPDGETLFTSIPSKEEITYMPGTLLMLSKEGKEIGKFKVESQGFNLEFIESDLAFVRFASERGTPPVPGYLKRDEKNKWLLTFDKEEDQENEMDFGAGINTIELKAYSLKRTGKKIYVILSEQKQQELKLPAAIYEAYETPQGNILLRVGTRTISVYSPKLEKVLEIKENENILSVRCGSETFGIITKSEFKGYSTDGKLQWKYSSLPKSYESKAYWFPGKGVYLWVVGNNLETVVASIDETGTVHHSQSFDKKEYHWEFSISLDQQIFVAQGNQSVKGFNV
ncbi:hypothetical protein [Bacillus sp. EB01]|uniref:hypothetical protein n=1 Tax=Bacillus sp. EB01 TaxID=1347086 RepID=UPI0005C66F67|nr:hypothetical protein [Bacillus sp. EB01]